MNYNKYSTASAEDLASDPYFREWVLDPTKSHELFWTVFLEEYPQQALTVQEARDLVLAVRQYFDMEAADPQALDRYYEDVKDRVRQHKSDKKRRIGRRRALPLALAAAAAIALLLLVGDFVIDWFSAPPASYETAYGERRVIELPDGSVVNLNAHSRLVLGKNWKQGNREVWLDGEAYFSVQKKPATRAKFTVHTQGLDIEVLGTQFNVNAKQEYTRVLLEEGKVRLRTNGAQAQPRQEVVMVPGQLADYSRKTGRITQRQLQDTETVTSWKEGYLIYESATLGEVIADIQSTYGMDVRVSDSLLLKKTIRGALPTDDLDEFLQMVETLFGVKALKSDKQVILQEQDGERSQ